MVPLRTEQSLRVSLFPGSGWTGSAWNRNTLPSRVNSLPTISALKFNGALTMAVGTSTGQVSVCKLEASHFSVPVHVCMVGNSHLTSSLWEQKVKHCTGEGRGRGGLQCEYMKHRLFFYLLVIVFFPYGRLQTTVPTCSSGQSGRGAPEAVLSAPCGAGSGLSGWSERLLSGTAGDCVLLTVV